MTRVARSLQSISMVARTLTLFAALWAALMFVQVAPAGAASAITDADVAERVANAKTAADHEALAAYFRDQAAAAGEKVKLHEAMLKSSAHMSGKSAASWELHCKSLIKSYKEAQKEAEGLAADHERMAQEAGK